MVFQEAKWIWAAETEKPDHYVQFLCGFDAAENAALRIAAETNYAVWLNGVFLGCGQYHDYPESKAYDEYDLTGKTVQGRNTLAVLAYAMNVDSSWHVKSNSGAIFEVTAGKDTLVASGEHTLCREAPDYVSGPIYAVTVQVGSAFRYDHTRQDDWQRGESLSGFSAARVVEKPRVFRPRPTEKPLLLAETPARIVAQGLFRYGRDYGVPSKNMQYAYLSARSITELAGRQEKPALPDAAGVRLCGEAGEGLYVVADLLTEQAGFLSLDAEVEEDTEVDVSFGEHLDDLRVRSFVGGRNFAVTLRLKAGRNVFRDALHRIGCRYLQLHFHAPRVTLYYAGLRPYRYPLTRFDPEIKGALERRIYDTSVRTLALCMHEHYEDCPWREQSQYAMDSRNQMLCGYYAFREYRFPRAALCTMVERLLPNGNLPLTSPSNNTLFIPSFSLVYFLALGEYVANSGDETIVCEVGDKCDTVLNAFLSRIDGTGLIPRWPGADAWNFYEWAEGLDNMWGENEEREKHEEYHAVLNCFLAAALRSYAGVCKRVGQTERAETLLSALAGLQSAIHRAFWDGERGVYASYRIDGKRCHYAELTQAMALYCGAAPEEVQSGLREKLASGACSLVPLTLSSSIYKYDALLAAGDTYRQYVKDEVTRIWGGMLYQNATTFWETEKGGDDFEFAGSLCHGWSAVPAYLYHRYGLAK